MGYYTDYTIDVDKVIDVDKLVGVLRDVTGYCCWDHDLKGTQIKWYKYKKHMELISKDHFPGFLFTVNGTGENHEDVWRAYFKDGKSKLIKAELLFPEFTGFD